MVHSEADVYTEYVDPRRDEWQTTTLPALKQILLNRLVELSGMSPSALKELRAGRSRPRATNAKRLVEIARKIETMC